MLDVWPLYPALPRLVDRDEYRTAPGVRRWWLARCLPDTLAFYDHTFELVWRSWLVAKLGRYDGEQWLHSSRHFLGILERCGATVEITGLEHIRRCQDEGRIPVIGSNHMSSLETFLLPCVVRPAFPVTFVIKPTLLAIPLLAGVLRTRGLIVVSRSNPREDLRIVLEEGSRRIAGGQSVIVFPQSTRTVEFDREHFNSLAVKLARKAGAPLLPCALKTDAWGVGRLIRDFGPFDKNKKVRLAFGAPIEVEDSGPRAQHALMEHIRTHLEDWKAEGD